MSRSLLVRFDRQLFPQDLRGSNQFVRVMQ
jgi:hypothetical protein